MSNTFQRPVQNFKSGSAMSVAKWVLTRMKIVKILTMRIMVMIVMMMIVMMMIVMMMIVMIEIDNENDDEDCND